MSRILIHTTSLVEAKPLINYFKLENNSKELLTIFENDKIILIVSAISKDKISFSLKEIFNTYDISKAFDLSVASCCDGSIKLGTLFCTNRFLKNINFAPITTLDKFDEQMEIQTLIADKQAQYFTDICKENIKDYYVLKVVSDYFEDNVSEDKINELIISSINKWKDLI